MAQDGDRDVGNLYPERTKETEQYILNLTFDKLHQLLMTGMLGINMSQNGPDGNPGRYDRLQVDDATGGLIVTTTNGSGSSTSYALRMDTGATYTYIGDATPGTTNAGATWRVKRLTNADNTIVWADGNANFDNVWNDHLTLSYS